jgi:hypothetical protein
MKCYSSESEQRDVEIVETNDMDEKGKNLI